jgi:hypothetical protein
MMTLRATVGDQPPASLPADDIAALPDLGSAFNDAQIRHFSRALLTTAGLALPDDRLAKIRRRRVSLGGRAVLRHSR